MTSPDSLRSWLRQEVQQVLKRKAAQPPFLLWCDPDRVWRELLVAAAEGGEFDLWADDVHELLLRERFFKSPRSPRVIWLPVSREALSYIKVYEAEAEVWELTLVNALTRYGVEIPQDQLPELAPLLPAHAREWLDLPKVTWKELTYGSAKGTLIDDDLILETLASSENDFTALTDGDRFGVFARRVTEDFGLPSPDHADPSGWRRKAMAVLLVTDAAAKCPDNIPTTVSEMLVPEGTQRSSAMKLLSRWQKRRDLDERFEELANKADNQTGLGAWASGLTDLPQSLASPLAERAVYDAEVGRLQSLREFDSLAGRLTAMQQKCRDHAQGFWGAVAKVKVPWDCIAKLADLASLLRQQQDADKAWRSCSDAVAWFTGIGWKVDWAGEILFRDDASMPSELAEIRTRLKRAFLHHLARTNVTFSELVASASNPSVAGIPLDLPHAGEVILGTVEKATIKDPMAVIFLDACRYDLGCRLAALLNEGEPVERAKVTTAKAPLPSITALGMAFALPVVSRSIRAAPSSGEASGWTVSVEGFEGNLSLAAVRRSWLKKTYQLKDSAILSLDEVADSGTPDDYTVKTLGRLTFLTADDLDDHDEVLRPFGADSILERYARVIRRLRTGGYTTVLVVTDHGFFRWDPESDEVEGKPSGEVLWTSRRAVVGRNLKHATALAFGLPGGSLTCYCPRSINSFRTYGGLGFFHGGATMQEAIIPVISMHWPRKAKKVQVVLKDLPQITSLSPRVGVAPAQVQTDMFTDVDGNAMGRQIVVKIIDPANGKVVFRTESAVLIHPGSGVQAVELAKIEGSQASIGAVLSIQVVDADDEELLDRGESVLKVEVDDWL
jgi:hypothetical protein